MAKKSDSLKALITRTDLHELMGYKPLLPAEYRAKQKRFQSLEFDKTYCECLQCYPDTISNNPKSLELAVSCTAILEQNKTDSLEQIRKKAGMDKYREELIAKIQDSISFERGLARTLKFINKLPNHVLESRGITKAEKLEDVAKVMPEITSAEIAWLSTIKGFPAVYHNDHIGVPAILDFDVDGIEFGFDGHNAHDLTRGERGTDAYVSSGMTGVTETSLHHEYAGPFGKAFKALAALVLSDRHVYKTTYSDNKHYALAKGDGKLKREIVARGFCGDKILELDSKRLADLNIPHSEIRKMEKRIGELLSNKNIMDLGNYSICTPKDLVTLVGMLETVPETLLAEMDFNGYVLPFGKGVKILDSNGKEVEYVPYDPYLQIRAQQELHYTPNDISRANAVCSMIFNTFADDVEGRFALNSELPADRLRMELRQKYGITIPTRSVKTIMHDDGSIAQQFQDLTKLIPYEYSLKLGLDDLSSILRILDSIPMELVPEISEIRREYYPADAIEGLVGRVVPLGRYQGGKLYLFTPEDRGPHDFSRSEKQLYRNTIAHEIGHGVLNSLDEIITARWNEIFKECDAAGDAAFAYNAQILRNAAEGVQQMQMNDLKQNTEMDLPKEDFCNHFAIYLHHRQEFKEKAADNAILAKKYNFFKDLFRMYGHIEDDHEYSPLATLDEIYETVEKLSKKRDLRDAVLQQNLIHAGQEEKSIEARARVYDQLDPMDDDSYDDEPEDISGLYDREGPDLDYDNPKLLSLQRALCNVEGGEDVSESDLEKTAMLLDDSVEKATKYLAGRYQDMDSDDLFEILDAYNER